MKYDYDVYEVGLDKRYDIVHPSTLWYTEN